MNFVSRSLMILLSGLLIFSSLDTLSHAVVENPTHQVKGILGGSVLFPANVSQGITVQKMEWDFYPQRGGLGFWLAEFSHGKLEHQSPTNQFEQRLDMVDETTLRIKDLELDDSGIYNARIWLTKTQFQEQRFSLTVYEPVPTPQIHHQVESKTPGGCNVTLRCHTPGREDLSISWETGDPHRALGKSVNQYQVSDNGRELRVSFWNSSFDSKFTCLASNPVDQKRASFDLLNICQSYEVILVAVMMAVAMMLVSVPVLVLVMKISKRHRRGVGSLMEKKGESTLTLQNSKMIDDDNDDDDDDEVDSDREELTTSSTPPRESFPSPNSSPVSDTEPSEIEHCIPQTNMGDQAQHETSVTSLGATAEEFTEGPSVERPTEDLSSLPVEPELQPTASVARASSSATRNVRSFLA